MNIGIIGAGNIGATIARLLVEAGHEVAIANSRGPDTLQDLIKELGPRASAVTVEKAALFGDVVLLAIPLKEYASLPAKAFAGKIVIDANNYYPERDGHFPELDRGELTSSEMIAHHLSQARVVKAFNTIYFGHLATQGNPNLSKEERKAIFLAGDDAKAKQIVAELIEALGFVPIDTGTLREGGRRQQPGTPLYNHLMTGREAQEALGSSVTVH